MTWTDGLPIHPGYQDSYYSREDGAAESSHVFLGGNDLAARFAQAQGAFTIGELGFGTALNFLLTWQLWDETRRPDARLSYVAVEAQPLSAEQMRQALTPWPGLHDRAEHLRERLPEARAGFQHIRINDNVDLLLLVGDVQDMLDQAQMTAHAWFLDGFAPSRNAAMWAPRVLKRVAELSQIGASFATYSAAGHVRRTLLEAGFQVEKTPGFGRKREMLKGQLQERPSRSQTIFWATYPEPTRAHTRIALVGRGIVGACQARVLAERGYHVDVYGDDDATSPRIPALLVRPWPEKATEHGISISERFYQHAFEQARALYARCCPAAWEDYGDCGTLRPQNALTELLNHPNIQRIDARLERLEHERGWRLNADQTYTQLVLCSAEVPACLTQAIPLPINPVAGQCVRVGKPIARPRWRETHALPLDDDTLIGGTYRPNSRELHERDEESRWLLQTAAAWAECALEHAPALSAHTGIRFASPDHLPVVGPCPDFAWWQTRYAGLQHGERHQAFPTPKHHHGLWLNLAHGSRGATAAVLSAIHLNAAMEGAAHPLESDIVAALHPGRFAIRRLRRGKPIALTDESRAAGKPTPSLRG